MAAELPTVLCWSSHVCPPQWRRDFDVDGLEGESFPPQLEAGGRMAGRDRAGNPVSNSPAARCGVAWAWGLGPGVRVAASRTAPALIPEPYVL